MATKTIKAKMQQYCGTAVELSIANAVLLKGQLGIETDTRKMKIGDGVTSWNNLPYTATGGSGIYVGSLSPTDPDVNVWIDPEGTPSDSMSNAITSIEIVDSLPTTEVQGVLYLVRD